MYGQFHNQFTLTSKRSKSSSANEFLKTKNERKTFWAFITLLLITISVSSTTFAGSSQPKLRGGNGNAQGR